MQIRVSDEVAAEITALARESGLSVNYVGNLCVLHGLPFAREKIKSLKPTVLKPNGPTQKSKRT